MKRKYAKNVLYENLELKIKGERGFLMKNKEDVKHALTEEIQHLDDPDHPMSESDWAHNQGWIAALEWVLDGSNDE